MEPARTTMRETFVTFSLQKIPTSVIRLLDPPNLVEDDTWNPRAQLTMDNTARSGAPRADGIGYPSPWATRSVRPPLRPRLRLLLRPHPNPFPLAVAQA